MNATSHKGNPNGEAPYDPGAYWDRISGLYQAETRISVHDVHYGPLVPGENELQLLGEVRARDMLELGCGGGQNSIALARRGARALGVDLSPRQIEYARALAAGEGVEAHFEILNVETELNRLPSGAYDCIHTAWGLSFIADLQPVLRECHRILRPGGQLLIATGHPVFAGEWIQLDQGEEGIFLTSYFDPPADIRHADDLMVAAYFQPVGRMIDWLVSAGFRLQKLVEPRAPSDTSRRAPYWSPSWEEMAAQLRAVPIVAVYVATRIP